MLIVPFLLLVVLPVSIGLAAKTVRSTSVVGFMQNLPHSVARPILGLPPREQLVVLVLGYLLAPLFLIVPLMLSSVLAADAFAGEKERRTLETLLLVPIALAIGAVIWIVAVWLVVRGGRRFTRDRIAEKL